MAVPRKWLVVGTLTALGIGGGTAVAVPQLTGGDTTRPAESTAFDTSGSS